MMRSTFAVSHSNRYIPDRFLPDKAIDLIDEAGARVKLRQTSLPEEITEVQKRIKFIVHRMENAIANHEFEKARFYSDEERKERENLRAPARQVPPGRFDGRHCGAARTSRMW